MGLVRMDVVTETYNDIHQGVSVFSREEYAAEHLIRVLPEAIRERVPRRKKGEGAVEFARRLYDRHKEEIGERDSGTEYFWEDAPVDADYPGSSKTKKKFHEVMPAGDNACRLN